MLHSLRETARAFASLGAETGNVSQARLPSDCGTGAPTKWQCLLALNPSLPYAPRAWGTGYYLKAYCILIDKIFFIIIKESYSLFLKL